MPVAIVESFFHTVTSPFSLFVKFLKAPLAFHTISLGRGSIRSAAALYLMSGVLLFYGLRSVYDHIDDLSGGDSNLSQSLGFADIPLVVEIGYSIYGLIFLLTLMPGAYFLSSRRNSRRTFNDVISFMFCMGSVNGFIYAIVSVFATWYVVSTESLSGFLERYLVYAFAPMLVVFIVGVFVLVNIRRFVLPLGWLHVVTFVAVSILCAIPFSLLVQLFFQLLV